jgi:hypothetical protein
MELFTYPYFSGRFNLQLYQVAAEKRLELADSYPYRSHAERGNDM